ncbi:MAG: YhcH/YjgK/YiaL family protein [Bacteroidetes bacterium]|nr:YhcH/YjgK/YiaL family protein [Bacteroidota bacterium]
MNFLKSNIIFLIMIILTTISCSNTNPNPEKWGDEEVNQWFEKQEWLAGWQVSPDASINKRSFANLYYKNPRHWDQAFQFLKSADLKNMPLGKQELEGKHLFVSVDEYTTKDKSETKYESHKKYIDIQYVIEGEELMGLTTLDKVKVTEPYDSSKDLIFYEYDGGDYVKTTPDNFVIFFPEDAHRPMMKVNNNSKVRKIVVKIMIE